MGGGGGYSGSGTDPQELQQRAREELARQELNADINEFLADQLISLNDRDAETINSRLDQVTEALGEKIEDLDRLLFGGSIAKHTYVDGLSDVDALVILKGPSEDTPSALIRSFARTLRNALPPDAVSDVQVGRLAVTVTYQDGVEVQLLPARERQGRISISSEDGKSWKEIRPRKFAAKLTKVNRDNGGGVVPAIKLAKFLIDRHMPATQKISGYHLEAIAVDAFKGYHGSRDRRSMVQHLIEHASSRILSTTGDITGQTVHIDAHLGVANSNTRKSMSASLRRINQRMNNASTVEAYRDIFGE